MHMDMWQVCAKANCSNTKKEHYEIKVTYPAIWFSCMICSVQLVARWRSNTSVECTIWSIWFVFHFIVVNIHILHIWICAFPLLIPLKGAATLSQQQNRMIKKLWSFALNCKPDFCSWCQALNFKLPTKRKILVS